ncbi:hypothetical protein [Nocardia sp. NPDC058633]|uniref:hypothetical protein n=1 Tax=Nocardia sp. NPDC058633 TaxID=3346568 RepID=UPI003649AF01
MSDLDSRPPFYLVYETAEGKPSGVHAHIGPCTCPPELAEQYPEPAPRSLAADMLVAVLTLVARRMP